MPKVNDENGHTDAYYARVDAIVVLLLKNQNFMISKRGRELVKEVISKFQIGEDAAEKYIAEAKREVRRLGRIKKEKAYQRAVRDREFIVQKYKDKDPKLALVAMKDRDELIGLYTHTVKQDVSVSMKDVNLNSLTDEQLLKLREMLQKGIELRDALLHIGVIIK